MAGIDWQIPLGVRGPQVESPMNTLGRMYQFEEMRAQMEARELQRRKMAEAEADREAMGAAFSTPRIDRKTAIDVVQRMGRGHLVPIINKQFDDWDASAVETRKKIGEAAAAEQAYTARLFHDVAAQGYDPFAARAAIDHAESTFGEQFAPKAEQYRRQLDALGDDTNAIKAFVEGLRRQDPAFAARQSAEASERRAITGERTAETERPGKEADARTAVRAEWTARLAAAGSQTAYDRLREDAPKWMDAILPPKYDRERLLQIGLTPVQATADSDRDAVRAETRRHNIQTEAQARASLNETIAEHKRVAERGGGEGMTPNRQSVIEQWRGEQLLELEKQYQAETVTNEQYGKLRAMIERTYQEASAPGMRQAPPTSTAQNAPGTLGALVNPPVPSAPPRAATPKPAPATGDPMKEIAEQLKGQPAGIYEDEDTGVRYRKGKDGKITVLR